MKTVCIFAHFDKDSIIDDYVIYYIKELKKITDSIIFSSANNLEKEELSKIINYVDYCIAENHGEYDWGSYKRGYLYLYNADKLTDYDCLIFANDSCAGPLYPLGPIINEMNNRKCDFWGLTKNNYGFQGFAPHIQTYFLGLKKEVFTSNAFYNFIQNVKPETNKTDIVMAYEVGFTKSMINHGFIFDVYNKSYEKYTNVVSKKWRELIQRKHFPLFKLRVARLTYTDITTSIGWQNVIKATGYPVELIESNIKRTQSRDFEETNVPLAIKKIIYNVANFIPAIGKLMKKHSAVKKSF